MRARQVASIRVRFDPHVAALAASPRPRSESLRGITVFVDRDGVLVRDRPGYVKSWDEVEILPGALAALARLAAAGARIFVATNQSAVGRGIVSRDVVDDIHARLASAAAAHGARIDDFLVCPHRPDDGCSCRKPKPGLLLQAQLDRGLDLENAYMVGDQGSDALTGIAAGCTPILVGDQAPSVERSLRARTLDDAVDLILDAGRSPG
jgi:D-glycero-D-manno-heptose 1,7-bisphosphate phosphatase